MLYITNMKSNIKTKTKARKWYFGCVFSVSYPRIQTFVFCFSKENFLLSSGVSFISNLVFEVINHSTEIWGDISYRKDIYLGVELARQPVTRYKLVLMCTVELKKLRVLIRDHGPVHKAEHCMANKHEVIVVAI